MSNPIVDEVIAKTMQELNQSKKPQSTSRSWQDPTGYRFLTPWSNTVLLRIFIRKLTNTFPRSEYRRKNQMDDAARSTVRNIEEGFKRSNTKDYLAFIGFSQGSLEEIKGDIRECLEDKLLQLKPKTSLNALGINLKAWNDYCKTPLNSSKILYFPLKENKGMYRNLEEIKGEGLTYEIFIELTNKSDWLLRKLVQSLERKIQNDKINL